MYIKMWWHLQNGSYLSHLVVSCHQVLNCLAVHGGYLLDVCAFLLVMYT